MPKNVIHQNELVLYGQKDGRYTAMAALGVGLFGSGEKTYPGAGVSAVYVTDAAGNPVILTTTKDAPTALPSQNVTFFETGGVNFFQQKFEEGAEFDYQIRYNPCTRLDNPNGWRWLQHFAASVITGNNTGEGPSLEFDGSPVTGNGDVMTAYRVTLVKPVLEALTTGIAFSIAGIASLSDVSQCDEAGYPGPDKVIVLAPAADTGVAAEVLFSINGGGAFTAFSNDPFGADENLGPIAIQFITDTQVRVITTRASADASNPAEIAYATARLADLASATWTNVDTPAANNSIIEAFLWAKQNPNIMLIATAGDIYLSANFGESILSTPVYTSTDVVNQIVEGQVGNIWAVTDAGTILKASGGTTTFASKTGPTGSTNADCIAEANNGAVYLGDGTKLYRSIDNAETAGGWTELKDFGTNRVVKRIGLAGVKNGGDPQLIRVEVDNTSGTGEIWISVNGGASFEQIPAQTNTGYNDAVFSDVNDNIGFFAGDGGVLHRYTPSIQ